MTKKQLEAALWLAQEQLRLNVTAWAQVINDPTNPTHAALAAERFLWNTTVLEAILKKMS